MVPGTNNKPGDGVSRHVYEISKRLSKKGFELVNIEPSTDGSHGACLIDDTYILAKVPVTNLQAISTHLHKINRVFELASHYIQYREAVRKFSGTLNGPILIHTHGFYAVCQPRNRSRKHRRVVTLHGFVPLDMLAKEQAHTQAIILRSFLRRIYKKAEKWTAISDRIKSMAINLYGIDQDMITVVPHGVSAKFFSKNVNHQEIQKIEERFRLDKPYRILFLGQLDRGKRPDILLKAFKILRSRRHDVMLVIRSSWGDYYSDTLQLVKALKIQDIVRIIREHVYGSDLATLYKASCTFVSIHLLTGPSTALLEAMASGVPPIIYKHSSHRDVVNESCGIILDTLDPLDLANSIENLIEDKALARRIGHNAASKMLKEHDWDNIVVPRYVSLYDSLIQA